MLLSINKYEIRSGRKVCVYHYGNDSAKRSILFIHDLGGSAIDWQPIWRRFSKEYNLIAYDMLGHGLSDAPKIQNYYSTTNQVIDAQAILERYIDDHFIIACHGFGASIGKMLAILYPTAVKKLMFLLPDLYAGYYKDLVRCFSFDFNFHLKRKYPRVFSLKRHVLKSYLSYLSSSFLLDAQEIKQTVLVVSSKGLDGLGSEYEKLDHITRKHIDAPINSAISNSAEIIYYYLLNYINKLNVRAFRNLVFKGAGIRGISYCGALLSLDALGVLGKIKRVAGSSSGSIYATFIALGYSSNEIHSIVKDLDFSHLKGSASGIIKAGARFLSDFGWHKGDKVLNTMGDLIGKKTGDPDITFSNLHEISRIELYIIGTNLTYGCYEVYSHQQTPNMKVKDAVRISSSIPIWYEAVKRKDANGESILVDGGLSWNYPLDIFDYDHFVEDPVNMVSPRGSKKVINYETLGFRLEPFEDPLHDLISVKEHGSTTSSKKISNWIDYAKSFLRLMHASTMRRHLDAEDWSRTIYINTLEIGAADFDISQNDKLRLIDEGSTGVYKHFSWKMSKDGVKFPQ